MNSVNTFEIVGILRAAEEEPYGQEGKTLAQVTVDTEVTDYKGNVQLVELVFSLFGQDKNKVLNVAPGARIKAVGHLTCRRGRSGGAFLGLNVTKLGISGGPVARPKPVDPPQDDFNF